MPVNAPPIPGTPEGTSSDHADCSTLNGDAVVEIRHRGAVLTPLDNATTAQLAGGVNKLVLPGVVATFGYPQGSYLGAPPLSFAECVALIDGASSHYPILLVQSTDSGQPVTAHTTTTGHYLTLYGTGGQVYQCVDASLRTYPMATLQAAYLGATVVSFTDPTTSPAYVPYTTPKDEIMETPYKGPDGLWHVMWTDAQGTVHDRVFNNAPAGAPGALPGGWQEGPVIPGAAPNATPTVLVIGAITNAWIRGTIGDLIHVAFTSGAWVRY